VITAAAAFSPWVLTSAHVPWYIAWVLAAGLLALGAALWLFVRRARSAVAAAGAEIVSLQGELGRALARIDRLTSSQGRFVGNIAHELKTPLSTVLGQAELLLACSDDPAAVRRYARSVGADMRHLSDLVESFLRLAHPFAQEDTSHHVPIYFHDFVVAAVRRSQSLARESGVRIVPMLAESSNGDVAPEVLGDSVLLEAMVENLVRNAVRFSPRGARVEVEVQVRGESVLLYVRDQGKGIAPEHLLSVFDWFFDMPAQARRTSGTGFGLAIAKRVAEHHDGMISLRNRAEGGCEFQITLPRCRAEDRQPSDGVAPVVAGPAARSP
jgi:signal transduction histidine kinase